MAANRIRCGGGGRVLEVGGGVLEVGLLLLLLVGIVCCERNSDASHIGRGRTTSNTSGIFIMAKSCGEVRAGRNREMVKYLYAGKPVWVVTTSNVTLQSRNGGVCLLQANGIYKVTRSMTTLDVAEGTLDVAEGTLDVAEGSHEHIRCNFSRDSELSLLRDEVYVSCIEDKARAEREILTIMSDSSSNYDPSTAPPSGPGHTTSGPGHTTSGPGHTTSGPGHTTSGPGHTTEREFQTRAPKNIKVFNKTTHAITVTSQVTSQWQIYDTTEIISVEDTLTPEQTEDMLESTSYAPEYTGEETEGNGNILTFPAEAEESSHETTINAFTAIYETQGSLQNSSQLHEQEADDRIPYFIGAGTCVVLLFLSIIIICIVQKRKPKRKAEENIEDFFIVGSNAEQDQNDGCHNAQIMMYSGAVCEEAVESLELEERILKSPVSSHELDTPKCLRSERIKTSTSVKAIK